MLFTSPIFLFFFLPLFISAYYLAPTHGQYRNHIALLGSILFFSWGEPVYVLFLISSVFFDYKLSKTLTHSSPATTQKKKWLLFLGIGINVIVLIAFKYITFLVNEILLPLHLCKTTVSNTPILLGISFITFHKVSYLVDSFKGRAVPPRNFYDCALYIFLFPQLIAGPIIRYHDIGQQIFKRIHTSELFLIGCFRFCVGFSKKILIADQVGMVADRIFAFQIHNLTTPYAWLGAISYMLQIYFDFSGYSDMAIGLGNMIGFTFPENFNKPYQAKSVTDFWRRWHISLSNWMKLYLYIPLGGNRVSKHRTYINLWLVFLISGLWHGANWTFLAWGAYYGFFLCLEKYVRESFPNFGNSLPALLRSAITILIVLIGWVLFRSSTLSYACDFIMLMFGNTTNSSLNQPWGFLIGNRDLFLLSLSIFLVFFKIPPRIKRLNFTIPHIYAIPQGNVHVYAVFFSTLLLLIFSVMAMLSAGHTPFLYFRF